jgi:dTDP-4-dehydrorhamnose reductase
VRPHNSVLDSGKFEQAFGFVMPDWRSGTREVVGRLAQC